MKITQKILLSFIFSVVFFTVFISLSFTNLIPAYSALIDNLFLTQTGINSILIFTGAFLLVFFLFFAAFSLGSRKIKLIRSKVQQESDSLFDELLDRLPLMSLAEVKKELNYSKIRFAGELKMQYCKKSIRYVKLIDETIESRWLQLESLLEAQKRVELESDEEESEEELLSEVDETVLNSIQTQDVEELEEFNQAEPLNTLKIIEDLDAADEGSDFYEEGRINILEELDSTESTETAKITESAENSQIEELDEVEELEELEELEEVDDLEELEPVDELEETKNHDPYPELLNMLNKRPIYIATSNKTFISAETDNFATVDNVFAEDLCLGTEYTCSYAPFDDNFTFIPVRLDLQLSADSADSSDFADSGKLLPVKNQTSFSMTGFCSEKKTLSELSSASEGESKGAIVEKDGIYSISDNVSYSEIPQDSSLKKLVDSILH